MTTPRDSRDYALGWAAHRSSITSADSGIPPTGDSDWDACLGKKWLTVSVFHAAGSTTTLDIEVWLKANGNIVKSHDHDLSAAEDAATFRVNLDGDYDAFLVWIIGLAGTDEDISVEAILG